MNSNADKVLVTYDGPFAACEVDGIRIPRGGEATLTFAQLDRVLSRGVRAMDSDQVQNLREPRQEPTEQQVNERIRHLTEAPAPETSDEDGGEELAEEVN